MPRAGTVFASAECAPSLCREAHRADLDAGCEQLLRAFNVNLLWAQRASPPRLPGVFVLRISLVVGQLNVVGHFLRGYPDGPG
jgi:hypothetical protein